MAKTGSERTTAWRNHLLEQGYKQKSFLLSPAAVAALARAAREQGINERDIIEMLLVGPKRRDRA